MNPNQHFQGTQFPTTNEWARNTSNALFGGSPAVNAQRQAHLRYRYASLVLYSHDGQPIQLNILPQYIEQLKMQQRQFAAQGAYFKIILSNSFIDVLFNDIFLSSDGSPMASVMMVSPQIDGHPSLQQSLIGNNREEVPAFLLPQIPFNGYATGAQPPILPDRQPAFASGYNNAPTGLRSTPQTPAFGDHLNMAAQAPAGKPTQWRYASTRTEFLQSPSGTLFDDGLAVFMIDDTHTEVCIGSTGTRPSKALAKKYLQPTQVEITEEPRTLASEKVAMVEEVTPTAAVTQPKEHEYRHPLHYPDPVERGYYLEREWVSAHGGAENPVVAIDNITQRDITLDQLCGYKSYLKDGSSFTWKFNGATRTQQERWKTQYRAARYWCDREVPDLPTHEVKEEVTEITPVQAPVQRGGVKDVSTRLNNLLNNRSNASTVKLSDVSPDEDLPAVAIPISIEPVSSAAPVVDDEVDIADGETFLGEDIAENVSIEGDGDSEFQICVHDVFKQHSGIGLPAPAIPWSQRLRLVKARRDGNRMWLVVDREEGETIPAASFAKDLKVNTDEVIANLKANPEGASVIGAPDISVSLTILDIAGEVVDSGPVFDEISALGTDNIDAMQQVAQENGLDISYSYLFTPSSDQSSEIPVCASIAQAVYGLQSDENLTSTVNHSDADRYYHPLSAMMCDIYKVVGDADFGKFLTWVRKEADIATGPIDPIEFSRWMKGCSDRAAANQSDKKFRLFGQLCDSEKRNIKNLRYISLLNTMVTQLINRALRQQYGLSLSVVNYVEDIAQLRSEIFEASEALTASWIKTESDIIEQLMADLIPASDYVKQNEAFTDIPHNEGDVLYMRSTLVLSLAARYQDLDIQLDTAGQARSIPQQCNELTSVVLEQIDEILKAYDMDYMSTPLQKLDIYLALVDGVCIRLNIHPSMTNVGRDQTRWMASLVDII